MPENQAKKNQYLLFESANELFAFDINNVIELAPLSYIHRLPHKANSCILGIANINGDICIILSLAKLLNIENDNIFLGENNDNKKLVLCKSSGTRVAFLVDEIHSLSELDDPVEESDDDFDSISSISVFRVALVKNKTKDYTILDLELLINALERNYL